MSSSRLLNWHQACTLLGCSRSHFYNLVNSGRLPAIRTGEVKGVRVYEADCQEYLRKNDAAQSQK